MRDLGCVGTLLLGVWACQSTVPARYEPRTGDIVFHTSTSSQSEAIQQATRSPYSHMGIVFVEDHEAKVYEAVQPVKFTPLSDWTQRGKGGRFVVKRLRDDAVLNDEAVRRLGEVAETFRGRPYDLAFRWSDDQIYCSELVWKIYARALGIEIGALQTLAEFDLSSPAVKATMKKRWHGTTPTDEAFISPAAMFSSARLVTVFQSDDP